jgi:transcriptional regulator GlxA family with amidase domain
VIAISTAKPEVCFVLLALIRMSSSTWSFTRVGQEGKASLPLLETQAAENSVVGKVQNYVMNNLEVRHNLEQLAEYLEMSPRNLTCIPRRNAACH